MTNAEINTTRPGRFLAKRFESRELTTVCKAGLAEARRVSSQMMGNRPNMELLDRQYLPVHPLPVVTMALRREYNREIEAGL